jgi:DNA polymerase III subunit delta
MVAYKANAVQRFIDNPKTDCRAALVYGPDAGLVSDRAASLAAKLAPDGEPVRLDDRDLAEEPDRLAVEINTVPMFAPCRVVRVAPGTKLDVGLLRELLAAPLNNVLIIETGSLRPDSPLRKLFEIHGSAVALACYGDDRSVERIVDHELGRARLTIGTEARRHLLSLLGADQAVSRSEVEKLALFATGQGEVTREDIDAIVGDDSEVAFDVFVYAVSGGQTEEALAQLNRLAAAAIPPSVALTALGRHFTQLHMVASSEARLDEAARSIRPPLHFKRKPTFEAHCRRWGPKRLAAALPLVKEAVLRSRRAPELERIFAERLVLTLTATVRPAAA